MAARTEARRATENVRYAAPVGGINFAANTMDFPEKDSYLCDNMLPRPFGIEVRKGWRYWVPQESSFSGEVRSLMSFIAGDPIHSKLFCSPNDATGAIYDITTPNAAPVVSLTPTTPCLTSGEWYSTNFVTPGNSFLCVVGAGAGYFLYSVTAGVGSWTTVTVGATAGKVEFPVDDTTTLDELCFCWVWKNRLWFLKSKSATAYYLPVGSVTGKLEAFEFGPQLSHGGALAFGASWTYDSGRGIDDGLIIYSEEGEVLIYQGTDPASATDFGLKGSWWAGRTPVGRRGFCQHGGDLIVITEYGVIRIADLVAGRLRSSSFVSDVGDKINTRLAGIISTRVDQSYWELLTYAPDELLILATPFTDEFSHLQQNFVMNSITNAWATISGIDSLCSIVWDGKYIFGSRVGAVCHGFTGRQDGASSDGLVAGDDVTGRMQTTFYDFGNPSVNKRALRVKLYGLSESPPSIKAAFRSEYDLGSLLSVSAPVTVSSLGWDTSTWDVGLWDNASSSFRRWIGVVGFGKKLSMIMAIRGSGRVIFTDFEVLYETGINL